MNARTYERTDAQTYGLAYVLLCAKLCMFALGYLDDHRAGKELFGYIALSSVLLNMNTGVFISFSLEVLVNSLYIKLKFLLLSVSIPLL